MFGVCTWNTVDICFIHRLLLIVKGFNKIAIRGFQGTFINAKMSKCFKSNN